VGHRLSLSVVCDRQETTVNSGQKRPTASILKPIIRNAQNAGLHGCERQQQEHGRRMKHSKSTDKHSSRSANTEYRCTCHIHDSHSNDMARLVAVF